MTTTPKIVGRYRVVERIGQGGMGALFLAHDPVIDRLVAIKVLREGLDTGDLRERFRREARAAGRLRHPNIVTIFDVGEYEGQPFIAMEYLPGETLAELIKRKATLSLPRKLKLLEEVCDGLAYAHKSGIVHRDVKPANLMVEPDGVLKILDFGIVRIAESGMTQAGMLVGTLNYMSPEQVSGGQVDLRSDIFAVGAVGYELLKYEQAFPGTLQDGILYRIMNADPPPIETDLAPSDIYAIILKALQKDPSKRYRDLGAMRKELERARAALPLDEDLSADARDDIETEVIDTGPPALPLNKPSTGAEKRRAVLIERHLKTAEDALAAGDYRAALSAAEELMILDPGHAAGAEILDEAHVAVVLEEVRAEIERAREQLARGELDDAYQVMERATAKSSDYASQVDAEFRSLREDLESARERQRLVRGALSRANGSLDEEAYESAIRASNEILAVEPFHQEALRIREVATMAIDQRADDCSAAARTRFAAGDHQGAIAALEAAAPHPKIQAALVELRRSAQEIAERQRAQEREARLEAERLAQRAEKSAKAMEAALAAGDIDRAESLLGELRGFAPDFKRIPSLVKAIGAAREEVRRLALRATVNQLREEAEARIAAGELEAAGRSVTRITELAPNGPEAKALRARLDDRKRALAEQKAEIAASVQRGDFKAARAAIASVRAISATDADLAALGQTVDRAEAAALQEAETRRAFEEALSGAQRAVNAGDLKAAEAAVVAADRYLPRDPRTIEIQKRIHEAQAEARRRQEQIADQLKHLRRLAMKADFDATIAAADALLQLDPGNVEAQRVRDDSANALAKAEAERISREKREADRRRAGEEALSRAEAALAAGNLSQAGEAANIGGQNLPDDPRVTSLRQRLDNARAEARRRQESIEEQLKHVRQLLRTGDLIAATAAAEALRRFDPENADAPQLLDEIAGQQAAAEAERIAREKREADRRRSGEEALSRAEGALAAGDLSQAFEAANIAGQNLLDDPRVISLRQRVDGARTEARRRQESIDEQLKQVRLLASNGEYSAATAAADALLQFDPDNAEARQLLDQIAERMAAAEAARIARAQQEAENRRAFEEDLSRGEAALAAGELSVAIEAVNAAGQRIPDDPRPIELQRRVENAWAEARQRQDQIAAQLKELRRLVKKRDLTGATATADALLRFDPENNEAQRIREQIAAEVAAAEAARIAREQRELQRQREADERRQAKIQRDEEARERAEADRAARAERAEEARRRREVSPGGAGTEGVRGAVGLPRPSAIDAVVGQLRQLRPPQLLAAAAVVLLLAGAGVWSLWNAEPSPPPVATPSAPQVDPSPAPAVSGEAPAPTNPQPAEPDPPPADVSGTSPPEAPVKSEADQALERILSGAQQQLRRGLKADALNSLKAAEKIKPGARELAAVFGPLVNDARSAAQTSRAGAANNPAVTGTPTYAAAARRYDRGEELLRSGRMSAGIEALMRAENEFRKLANTPAPTRENPTPAATPLVKSADPAPEPPRENPPAPPPAAPPVKVEPPPKPAATTPPANTAPVPVDENPAIRAAMLAYQAAWNRMDLGALQQVQELSADEAARVRQTFAAAREYRLDLDIRTVAVTAAGRATVVAEVRRTFTAKVRQAPRPVVTTFILEKRGNTWIIVDLKV